jgi:hypothetical protein
MRTTITTRHCEIPAALKERAEAIVERLGQSPSAPWSVPCSSRAIITRRWPKSGFMRRGASCSWRVEKGTDHRSALDRAEEKLRNQLDKAASRPRARKARADRA